MRERGKMRQTHRYYSTTHTMKVVPPILTGEYLRAEARQAPPKVLGEALGMPVPPALKVADKEKA
jgi:NAD(P)H-quinone oxidoreductase subunit K